MMQLVAKYADAWNWWGWAETLEQLKERLGPLIELLAEACETVGRDLSTLGRTFDLYSVVPEGFATEATGAYGLDMNQPVTGTSEEIAEHILAVGALGFDEVRCDVYPKTSAAIEAMQSVVEIVHAG